MDGADQEIGGGQETGLVVNARHTPKFSQGKLYEVRTFTTGKRNVPIHIFESGSGAKMPDGQAAWVRRFTATLVTCKELPQSEWSESYPLHLNDERDMARLAEPAEPGGAQKTLHAWVLADILPAGNELTIHRGRSVRTGAPFNSHQRRCSRA